MVGRAARLGCSAAGITGTLMIGAVPALAQVTPQSLPSQGEISRERVTLPPVETPQFDLRIQAPDKSAVPKAVDEIQFRVDAIVVDGAAAFPRERVDAFFAPLLGKTIGLGAVRDAAQALEDLYRKKGFFLSRVFIPPQQLENGRLTVTVVEGYIEDVTVEGLDSSTRKAVSAALEPLRKHRPIDLASVERQLLILNDIPGVSGTSVLRQGTQLGASDLMVTLVAVRNSYAISVNNIGSRILGPWSYSANGNFNRPFGIAGALNLGVNAGGRNVRAVRSVSARYTFAVGTQGLIASLGLLAAKARPQGSITALDVRTKLISISTRARYPLLRGRANSLFLESGLSVNRSDTDILGQRLVEDRTTVVDVGLTFQQNGWLNGATTVSANVYHGLPVLGAIEGSSPRPSVADFETQFTRLTYAIQRIQQLPAHFSTLFSLQGQYTRSKLLSGELVSFGGPAIGRGFDPSVITGDRGVGGMAEIRYDITIPRTWVSKAQLYGFFDGARATNIATATVPESSQRIKSLGFGARIYHKYGLVDFQGAYAVRKIGGADERPNPRALVSATFLF